MSGTVVDRIARTILYEGYLLYPYRESALKNQQRWNFGVLYPPAWAALQTGSDRSYFQMECLVAPAVNTRVDVSLRFLQLIARQTSDRIWQEAAEQEVSVHSLALSELTNRPCLEKFSLPGGTDAANGVTRMKFPLCGQIEVSAVPVEANLFRLTVRAANVTDCPPTDRNDALLCSLASAHAVLRLDSGEFVSQVDPPERLRAAVEACQNTGVWPVLVGEQPVRDTMLGSPIILYDYPQLAPESGGDLFDSTEIDEILILRILTLSDEEKEEVRRSDDRARRILERLEAAPPEHLLQLHGALRNVRQPEVDAWSAWDTLDGKPASSAAVAGVELKKGDRVRLRPRKRADIFDTLLEGKIAVIEAVEEDFERNIHFAVVLEEDPGRDLGEMRQAAHRFFFSINEIEPVGRVASERS